MTELPYVVVDVFTDVALAGNPLAVFTDAAGLDGATMQRLARETNLSETTFVRGPLDGDEVEVRIFTPQAELPFAGHPVLGTASVIARRTGGGVVRLRCGVGLVPVAMRSGGGAMEQPIPTWSAFERTDELLAALGVAGSRVPVELYDNGVRHVSVVLGSSAEVAALAPDVTRLSALGPLGVSCCAALGGGRVHTRMFGPGVGVAEDPATGSAAGPLAVHLARHGVEPFGTELEIAQGAEIGRPSRIEARAEGAGDAVTRIVVGGSVVPVAEGVFRIG